MRILVERGQGFVVDVQSRWLDRMVPLGEGPGWRGRDNSYGRLGVLSSSLLGRGEYKGKIWAFLLWLV